MQCLRRMSSCILHSPLAAPTLQHRHQPHTARQLWVASGLVEPQQAKLRPTDRPRKRLKTGHGCDAPCAPAGRRVHVQASAASRGLFGRTA